MPKRGRKRRSLRSKLDVGQTRQSRTRRALWCAGLALGLTGLAACDEPDDMPIEATPEYLGVETRLLDGDLVGFAVRMKGAAGPDSVTDYAECAAAQYTLIRGYGFARHVRTLVDESAGIWSADAVYTISAALPRGERTIDAEVTVSNCALSGIPTV